MSTRIQPSMDTGALSQLGPFFPCGASSPAFAMLRTLTGERRSPVIALNRAVQGSALPYTSRIPYAHILATHRTLSSRDTFPATHRTRRCVSSNATQQSHVQDPDRTLLHLTTELIPFMKKYPLPQEDAKEIVRIIHSANENLTSLQTLADMEANVRECEAQVLEVVERSNATAGALRALAAAILQMTRNPQRFGVVGRLYQIAFRRGSDDAGYSWATMVLEGLIDAQNKEWQNTQVEEATKVYSQLARTGHAQSQFGMGRLVLAKLVSQTGPNRDDKQIQMAIDLWQRAGRNGYADAWYELGQLYHSGQLVQEDKSRAKSCFQQGARGGSALASYALGTIYLAHAKKEADSGHMDECAKHSALAARYFMQAAQKGHAASAYNIGLLYLHPDTMPTTKEGREEHKMRHGVLPDDHNAREWFAAAAARSTYRFRLT